MSDIPSDGNPSDDDKWPPALVVGIAVSVLILSATGLYLYAAKVWVWWSDAEKFGTFVAGISGALAFLWLVVATFLQMDELRLQRRELRSSREAQQHQARKTETLVEQNMAAVAVARSSFGEQQKRWKEEQLDKLVDTIGKKTALVANNFIVNRGIHNTAHVLYIAPEGTHGDTVVRNSAEQIERVTPFKLDDHPTSPVQARKSAKELIDAIDIIQTEIIKQASTEGVETPFPALEYRIEMMKLYEFRKRLDGVLHWLRSIPI